MTHDPTAKTWIWRHTALNSSATRTPVTVTITDAENNKSSVSFELLVTNVAPNAVLGLPAAVKAQGALTLAVNPTSGDTLTIGDRTYTFAAAPATGAAGRVLIGSTLAITQSNLVKAIAGTDTFNTGHPLVTISDFATNRAVITAKLAVLQAMRLRHPRHSKPRATSLIQALLALVLQVPTRSKGRRMSRLRSLIPPIHHRRYTAGFTYAYDFGDGFVTGTAVQSVPSKLLVDDGQYRFAVASSIRMAHLPSMRSPDGQQRSFDVRKHHGFTGSSSAQ